MIHTDLRKKFIEFFTSSPRNHKEIPSSSLVPENDPTSLFTSSGMQPLISYLLGEKHPLGTRLVNSQKCFRTQDIEEIGDNRHTTFFEMLGNWSLGDYFKKEQLPWIWQFLTEELSLKKEKLFVSVFEGTKDVPKDEESVKIWKSLGIPEERIFYYGVSKNWWSRSGEPENMPSGEPGGPDSEVFFDFGLKLKIHENSPYKNQKCHPNCDCGRFLEIANSVFMQYQKQADGTLKELPNKNVDFGGGLERMIAAKEDEPDIFKTNLYKPLIEEVEKFSNLSYSDEKNKAQIRVITDHIKAATFLIADGVMPSNKAQGYILRRLIRRASVKYSKLKNNPSELLPPGISIKVLEMYDGIYFDKSKQQNLIYKTIEDEVRKFQVAFHNGIKIFEKQKKIDAKVAFDLLQTFGFPLELTIELAEEKGQKINKDEFQKEFQKHQELSRTAAKGMFKGGLQNQSEETIKLHTATHLLQQALRTVLGDHVRQKGSHITAERLRFDFSHPAKMTDEEIKKVEDLVNQKIKENLSVSMKIVGINEAIKEGALTVPDTQYPEKVKVYSVGDPSTGSGQVFSKEVCGGPHVDFTGSLGTFKIIKEEALAANIRRVYAILET